MLQQMGLFNFVPGLLFTFAPDKKTLSLELFPGAPAAELPSSEKNDKAPCLC
jgi:hypothetical protein